MKRTETKRVCIQVVCMFELSELIGAFAGFFFNPNYEKLFDARQIEEKVFAGNPYTIT